MEEGEVKVGTRYNFDIHERPNRDCNCFTNPIDDYYYLPKLQTEEAWCLPERPTQNVPAN